MTSRKPIKRARAGNLDHGFLPLSRLRRVFDDAALSGHAWQGPKIPGRKNIFARNSSNMPAPGDCSRVITTHVWYPWHACQTCTLTAPETTWVRVRNLSTRYAEIRGAWVSCGSDRPEHGEVLDRRFVEDGRRMMYCHTIRIRGAQKAQAGRWAYRRSLLAIGDESDVRQEVDNIVTELYIERVGHQTKGVGCRVFQLGDSYRKRGAPRAASPTARGARERRQTVADRVVSRTNRPGL